MSSDQPLLRDTQAASSAASESAYRKEDISHPLVTLEAPKRPFDWFFGLYALQQASGATVLGHAASAEPLPPSQDPWYKAPSGFEKKQPGDILRIRQAPGNLTSIVSNSSEALHILYRTTNACQEPSWAVTTLFLPQKVYISPSGSTALLSYQFAYNSVNVDSGPSFGLYGSLAQDNPAMGLKSNTSFISSLLSQGWIVNTPDYSGYDAAFAANRQAGHATIDAIRSVYQLGNLTGSSTFTTAIWGYSGGTLATGAAVELLPSYAPELNIAGAVMGGMINNLASSFDRLNKSPIAATLIAILLGVTAQFPAARAYLESKLTPETKELFMSVIDIDVFDALRIFAGKDIYSFFIGGVADLHAPILQNLFEAQARIDFGDAPAMPLFIYKAIADAVCPIEPTDAAVEQWCAQGANILYERNTIGGHVSEIENAKPRALKWLWSIFDESYQPSADRCIIRDVSVEVSQVP